MSADADHRSLSQRRADWEMEMVFVFNAYRWAPADVTRELVFGRGRAPRMTYSPWRTSQRVELAATASDAWYRRCPARGCRVWAGPYTDASRAKDGGMEHELLAHPGDTRREW